MFVGQCLGIDGTMQMPLVGLIFVVIVTEKETGAQVVSSLASDIQIVIIGCRSMGVHCPASIPVISSFVLLGCVAVGVV